MRKITIELSLIKGFGTLINVPNVSVNVPNVSVNDVPNVSVNVPNVSVNVPNVSVNILYITSGVGLSRICTSPGDGTLADQQLLIQLISKLLSEIQRECETQKENSS